LGTNAILSPTGDSYIAVLHGVRGTQFRTALYWNFVYVFKTEPPYSIIAVASQTLKVPPCPSYNNPNKFDFTYVNSLARLNASHYVVGYGCSNVSGRLALLAASELMEGVERGSLSSFSRPLTSDHD